MWYKIGTIDVTNGSPTITGNGTSWEFNIVPGDMLFVNDKLYEILTVDSATQITLASNFLDTTATGISYAIIRNVVTNSNLGHRMTKVVDQWKTREDEITAWQGGTKTGGPNSDGKYPLTDPDGVTHLVYSPAAIADFAGGGARDWAVTAEDVEVDPTNYPGEYSSLHYSQKSKASAASQEVVDLTIAGDFTANTGKLLRQGKLRSLMIPKLNHSLDWGISSNYFIPSADRPPYMITTVYYADSGAVLVVSVYDSGKLYFNYREWDGSILSRYDTAVGVSISWLVE